MGMSSLYSPLLAESSTFHPILTIPRAQSHNTRATCLIARTRHGPESSFQTLTVKLLPSPLQKPQHGMILLHSDEPVTAHTISVLVRAGAAVSCHCDEFPDIDTYRFQPLYFDRPEAVNHRRPFESTQTRSERRQASDVSVNHRRARFGR
jgi:hypothetical protein